MIKLQLARTVAIAMLFCLPSLSRAALTVYMSEASFNAATSARGVDGYAGFDLDNPTPSPISRNAGPYNYTGTAPKGFFFGGGSPADPWLSTNTANDPIIFDQFSDGAQAIGGNFFVSDINGRFLGGPITVTAVDQSGAETQTIIDATLSSFLGFVSNDSLVSLTVTTSGLDPDQFASVDNLTIGMRAGAGTPTGVPEPGSLALLLVGLAGLLARRRGN